MRCLFQIIIFALVLTSCSTNATSHNSNSETKSNTKKTENFIVPPDDLYLLVRSEENSDTEKSHMHYKLPFNSDDHSYTEPYELFDFSSCDQDDSTNLSTKDSSNFLRYIQMPPKDDIDVILVPHDEGDYPYRYYLYTFDNCELIDGIYVEGEWWEPGVDTLETTSFCINANYIISVKTGCERAGLGF